MTLLSVFQAFKPWVSVASSAAGAVASAAGTIAAASAAAGLSLMMNPVIQQVPDVQTNNSKDNNRYDHGCHDCLLSFSVRIDTP